jgi:hypothetical protein
MTKNRLALALLPDQNPGYCVQLSKIVLYLPPAPRMIYLIPIDSSGKSARKIKVLHFDLSAQHQFPFHINAISAWLERKSQDGFVEIAIELQQPS